jgi:rsbT antagonist protein RsbS
VALDDRSVSHLQQELLQQVCDGGATGVILDVTAVDLVDSFMARSLSEAATAVHLLGAQLVIVGIQPVVAMTLVEMGLTIPNAISALNLEKGLELLRATNASSANGGARAGSSEPNDDR